MKYFLSLFVFILCSIALNGQKNRSVSGMISDEVTGDPIELASLRLLNAKDSSFVAGEFSDSTGAFVIKNITKGNYILQALYLGYKDLYKPVSLSGANLNENTGNLKLVSSDIMLQEAVVTGNAAEVVVRNDTIEYNADSYKTPPNSMVEDLLKKLPGVEVDNEGKITVNGKEVKKFMVDGKEFFSNDLTVASKNLPAEMIDKLQVMDRKSDLARMTGFDDGNEETIINLSIKPEMKQGLVGNAMAGIGQDMENEQDSRYEAAAVLNHMNNNDRYTLMIGGNNTNNMGASDRGARRGSGGIVESQRMTLNMNKEFSPKLSLNGDIVYNTSDRDVTNKVEQTTLTGDLSQLDKTLTSGNDISDNFTFNFRLEWRPDSSNTFIFSPNFGYTNSNSAEDEVSERLDYDTNDTISQTLVNSFSQGEGYNTGLSIDYSHYFKKTGRILSLNAQGSYNDSYSYGNSDWLRHDFENGMYIKDTERNQLMENDNKTTNLRAYISYVEPVGWNNSIQLAYSVSQFNTESLNSTYNIYENFDDIAMRDTAVLYGTQSRSTVRNSIEQRYTLNFKSVRKKYNYTVGVNIDPTNSQNDTYEPYTDQLTTEYISIPREGRMPNIKGDSLISNIEQNVVNFSPVVNFNYLFGDRSNLRIDYSGITTQPSPSQLRDYTDESNPNNQVKGNPNLKPGYSNQFSARFNKSVPESQLFYSFDFRGNYIFNDIASVTETFEDGSRLTTYENISGNWNTRLRTTVNLPLKNKKFTAGNFALVSYNNQKSFTNELENVMGNFLVVDRPNINYRSSLFDVGINGLIRYNNITYDIEPENNQVTLDWGAGAYTTIYLPYNFTVESDINWYKRSGYADGFNISEVIWNAAVIKQVFNRKFGTGSLKLKIYDILQDRNSISGSSTTNGFKSTSTISIPSFFMCSFIYKFSVFPKGSTATEKEVRGEDRGWGGGFPGGGRRHF